METILFEYAWVLLVLIALEGLLAADNAVVMAVMVKHLPKIEQKKALFYGLLGAFVFRFAALFLITFLVNIWQIQAVGALYLLYISIKNIYDQKHHKADDPTKKKRKKSGFWMTVLKVELADIAFALDSMLAAVALAVTLPELGNFHIGGINGGQFIVMLIGGIIGLVLIRFAARQFVQLLEKYPALETAAFLIVGWVGVKLAVMTLSHPNVAIIDTEFPHSLVWKVVFWGVLAAIAIGGYFTALASDRKNKEI